jgi:hypothetical protein
MRTHHRSARKAWDQGRLVSQALRSTRLRPTAETLHNQPTASATSPVEAPVARGAVPQRICLPKYCLGFRSCY